MTSGEPEKRSPLWRTVRIVVGVVLIPVGIVGLFVPILQGVFLLLLAFTLLASEIPFFARIRDKVKDRFPRYFRGDG